MSLWVNVPGLYGSTLRSESCVCLSGRVDRDQITKMGTSVSSRFRDRVLEKMSPSFA